MAKPNKENIITEILIELERGTTYKDCFEVILSKFKLSEPTFVTYWKIANERHAIAQQAAQKHIGDILTDNLIDRLNLAILNKNEALEILSKIAKAEVDLPEEGKMPNYPPKVIEQIQAIKTIADLSGWNSPVKTDIELKTDPLKERSYEELMLIVHGTKGTNNTGG